MTSFMDNHLKHKVNDKSPHHQVSFLHLAVFRVIRVVPHGDDEPEESSGLSLTVTTSLKGSVSLLTALKACRVLTRPLIGSMVK